MHIHTILHHGSVKLISSSTRLFLHDAQKKGFFCFCFCFCFGKRHLSNSLFNITSLSCIFSISSTIVSFQFSSIYIIFIYDRNFDHFVFTSWINWLLSQLYRAGLYTCLLIEHIISLPPHPVLIEICLTAWIHWQPINWWCVASRAITYMMCCKRQQRQFVSQLLWLPCQALLFYCC